MPFRHQLASRAEALLRSYPGDGWKIFVPNSPGRALTKTLAAPSLPAFLPAARYELQNRSSRGGPVALPDLGH